MDTPTLEGPGVRLEPLTLSHLPALEAIAFEPSISRHMVHPIGSPAGLRAWADRALAFAAAGTTLPWVTIVKGQNGEPDRVAGGTRFLDLDLVNRTTELGYTWLGAAWHGTRVNLEAKLLQLTFAFETLNLNRVAFKTHSANQRSQAAIRAIGASYEGTFRSHFIMPDGSLRDSCWFSILRSEWPDVKDTLTRRLHAPL